MADGTARSSSGDTRPPDSENAGPRAATWLGHLGAASSDLQRHVEYSPGLPLSRAPSSRASRVDQSVLGHLGQQPARQVLRADQTRARAPRSRDLGLAQAERTSSRRCSKASSEGTMLNDFLLRLRSLFRRDVVDAGARRRAALPPGTAGPLLRATGTFP